MRIHRPFCFGTAHFTTLLGVLRSFLPSGAGCTIFKSHPFFPAVNFPLLSVWRAFFLPGTLWCTVISCRLTNHCQVPSTLLLPGLSFFDLPFLDVRFLRAMSPLAGVWWIGDGVCSNDRSVVKTFFAGLIWSSTKCSTALLLFPIPSSARKRQRPLPQWVSLS